MMAFSPIQGPILAADFRATSDVGTDTANLLAALATEPKRIVIDTRDFPLRIDNGGVTIKANYTHIVPYGGRGRMQITGNQGFEFGDFWNFSANQAGLPAVTIGSLKDTITLGGVVQGQNVMVFSDEAVTGVWPHAGASGQQRPGELVRAEAVSGSTVTLDRPLLDDFTTNPRARVWSAGEGGGLSDWDIVGDNGQWLAVFYNVNYPRFARNHMQRTGEVDFIGCYGGHIDGNYFLNQVDDLNTYHMVCGLCTEMIFSNHRGKGGRHFWTTTSGHSVGNNRWGNVRDTVIQGGLTTMIGVATTTAHYHTHAEGRQIVFRDNTVRVGGGSAGKAAFQASSRDVTFINNRVYGERSAGGYGYRIIGGDRVRIEGGSVTDALYGVVSDPAGATRANNDVRVIGGDYSRLRGCAVFLDSGTGHVVEGIRTEDVGAINTGKTGLQKAAIVCADSIGNLANVQIRRNALRKGPSNDNSVHTNGATPTSKVLIDDNDLQGYGAGSGGMEAAYDAAYASNNRTDP